MGSRSLLLLHGPNLNFLGSGEPHIYGTTSLQDHVNSVRVRAESGGWTASDFQSNSESHLVEAVHAARGVHDAIIINPGAFTHYSWALHDALSAFDGPIVEVHISQPLRRESWRHTSVISPLALGTVAGFGGHGYVLAVDALLQHFSK